jgi:hypothetical protein
MKKKEDIQSLILKVGDTALDRLVKESSKNLNDLAVPKLGVDKPDPFTNLLPRK